ncbi:MAG: hypothetical protein MJZ02_09000, partial [Paludibacteraceae bacterium]|nr:hypothetical protein [Paludibacteraceae bacterium]
MLIYDANWGNADKHVTAIFADYQDNYEIDGGVTEITVPVNIKMADLEYSTANSVISYSVQGDKAGLNEKLVITNSNNQEDYIPCSTRGVEITPQFNTYDRKLYVYLDPSKLEGVTSYNLNYHFYVYDENGDLFDEWTALIGPDNSPHGGSFPSTKSSFDPTKRYTLRTTIDGTPNNEHFVCQSQFVWSVGFITENDKKSKLTISGTPTVVGDIVYTLTAYSDGCESTSSQEKKVIIHVVPPTANVSYCPTSRIVNVEATKVSEPYYFQLDESSPKVYVGTSNVFAFELPSNLNDIPASFKVFGGDSELEVNITKFSVVANFNYTLSDANKVNFFEDITAEGADVKTTSWYLFSKEANADVAAALGANNKNKAFDYSFAKLTDVSNVVIDPCGQYVALVVENEGCCKDTVIKFIEPNPVCTSDAQNFAANSSCKAQGVLPPTLNNCIDIKWSKNDETTLNNISALEGAEFENGDIVYWTLTNGGGTQIAKACSTEVVVEDNTKPTCPATPVVLDPQKITNDKCSFSQSEIADLFNAKDLKTLGSDNCELAGAEIDWTKTAVSSFVPNSDGSDKAYTLYYKLTDKAGLQNEDYCQATVVVKDNTVPVCPATQETISLETGENCYATGAQVKAEFDKAIHVKGTHPCGADLTYEYVNVDDAAPFLPYDHPVDLLVYTLKGSSTKTAQCTVKVQITDTRTLKCTSPAVQNLSVGADCKASLATISLPTASYDNDCNTTSNAFPSSKRYSSVAYEYKLNSATGYTSVASAEALKALNLEIGEYEVRTTFSRAASTGYAATQAVCAQTIVVEDATAPKCQTVTLPAITLTSACSAKNPNLLSVSDNCELDRVVWSAEGATAIAAGSQDLTGKKSATITNLNNVDFKPGTTTINWTVYDKAGKNNSCSSVITVTDKRPIECATASDALSLDIPVADYSECNVKNILVNAAYKAASAKYSTECVNDDVPVVTSYQVQPAGKSAVVFNNAAELDAYPFGIGTYYLHTYFKAANGKTVTCEQTLNFKDVHAPKLVGEWPENITGQNNCKADADILGLLTDTHVKNLYADCSKITVTHKDDTTGDNCGWTVTRTYTITDGTNSTTNTLKVSGKDQSKPVITTSLTNTDKGCNWDKSDAPKSSDFTLTETCDNTATITVTPSAVTETGCQRSQTWTATCTDKCGNEADPVSVTYTWTEDKVKPV